jgi:hypothetical protein
MYVNSFFFTQATSNLEQFQKKMSIREQHYKSLPPLEVAFVANITLLLVTAGFPVPLLD